LIPLRGVEYGQDESCDNIRQEGCLASLGCASWLVESWLDKISSQHSCRMESPASSLSANRFVYNKCVKEAGCVNCTINATYNNYNSKLCFSCILIDQRLNLSVASPLCCYLPWAFTRPVPSWYYDQHNSFRFESRQVRIACHNFENQLNSFEHLAAM